MVVLTLFVSFHSSLENINIVYTIIKFIILRRVKCIALILNKIPQWNVPLYYSECVNSLKCSRKLYLNNKFTLSSRKNTLQVTYIQRGTRWWRKLLGKFRFRALGKCKSLQGNVWYEELNTCETEFTNIIIKKVLKQIFFYI